MTIHDKDNGADVDPALRRAIGDEPPMLRRRPKGSGLEPADPVVLNGGVAPTPHESQGRPPFTTDLGRHHSSSHPRGDNPVRPAKSAGRAPRG